MRKPLNILNGRHELWYLHIPSKMKTAHFKPKIKIVNVIQGVVSEKLIADETMLFSASPEFAREHGGTLTNRVLNSLRPYMKDGKNYIIDTKSVMLMPGMYPAIPGWHCDGVIRKNAESQPDLKKLNDSMEHFICFLSSEENVSRTAFLRESCSVEYDPNRVWGSIDAQINKGKIKAFEAKEGEIIKFNQATLHCARPAKKRGWRFFIRMSEYHMPPRNEIRRQVQVYSQVEQGW